MPSRESMEYSVTHRVKSADSTRPATCLTITSEYEHIHALKPQPSKSGSPPVTFEYSIVTHSMDPSLGRTDWLTVTHTHTHTHTHTDRLFNSLATMPAKTQDDTNCCYGTNFFSLLPLICISRWLKWKKKKSYKCTRTTYLADLIIYFKLTQLC